MCRSSFRGFTIHAHSIVEHEGKWHFTVTVTSPREALTVEEVQLYGECTTKEEVADAARQQAINFIDDRYR